MFSSAGRRCLLGGCEVVSLVLDDRSVEVALMGKKWVLVVLGFWEVGVYCWERKVGGDRSKAAIVERERERESQIQRPVWGNINKPN